MARRTFVHIGLPKSGTTFLQTMMWRNRPALRSQGFLYPGDKRFDHYNASRIVRGANPAKVNNPTAWSDLRRSLEDWDGDGLVSHEFFCLATADQATAMVESLGDTEVHVVVTARDYVRQFPAVWQEALKMNYDGSLDEFVTQSLAGERRGEAWGMDSQALPDILERWSAAVPERRIHVVTIPRPGAPRELLWERWCRVLGIDDTDFVADTARANESLGVAQAALLHSLKPYLTGPLTEGPERHRWVRAYFGHEVLVPQGGERLGLRAEQVDELRALSHETADYLRQHDYDVVGEVDDLVPDEAGSATAHPDDVTVEEQLGVALRAIDQMIRDVRTLTLRNQRHRSSGQQQTAGRPRALLARMRSRISRRR